MTTCLRVAVRDEMQDLSESGRASLQTLAALATTLQLKDTRTSRHITPRATPPHAACGAIAKLSVPSIHAPTHRPTLLCPPACSILLAMGQLSDELERLDEECEQADDSCASCDRVLDAARQQHAMCRRCGPSPPAPT